MLGWTIILIMSMTSCVGPPKINQTPTPTRFARHTTTATPSPETLSTETPSPNPTETTTIPTVPPSITVETSEPAATMTDTPTPPPALPLRDDLPPLTLKDWPRPENDNGLGIHFVASGYYDAEELDKEIARIQSLHLKWVLVIYADENQLTLAAQKFKAAGHHGGMAKDIEAF